MTARKGAVDMTQVVEIFTSPAQCLQGLQEIVTACTDYLKVAEEERTKRCQIKAWEKETISQINATRDLLTTYLDRSFDERAQNFRKLFAVVDCAIASNNNQQLALALNSITELAKSSPFQELTNLASVQAALDDPEHKWEF